MDRDRERDRDRDRRFVMPKVPQKLQKQTLLLLAMQYVYPVSNIPTGMTGTPTRIAHAPLGLALHAATPTVLAALLLRAVARLHVAA